MAVESERSGWLNRSSASASPSGNRVRDAGRAEPHCYPVIARTTCQVGLKTQDLVPPLLSMQIHIRQAAAAAAVAIVVTGTAACGGGSGSSSKSSGLLGGLSSHSATSAGKSPSAGTSSSTDEDTTVDATLDGVDYCTLVDPAAITAAGLTAKGTPTTSTGATAPNGCYWRQANTILGIGFDMSNLSGFENNIQDLDFSGFPVKQRYDENLSECDIAALVGSSGGFRITLSNPGNDNPALKGKGCDVAAAMMKQALTKIKK